MARGALLLWGLRKGISSRNVTVDCMQICDGVEIHVDVVTYYYGVLSHPSYVVPGS